MKLPAKKRTLCILLAISFVFIFTFDLTERVMAAPLSDYERSEQVLIALDIIDKENYYPDNKITRGKFVAMVVDMCGMKDVDLGGVSEFSDVEPDYPYANAIYTATQLCLVNGHADGTFLPENIVSPEEAVKILVCATGYNTVAIEKGGYPSGYLSVAASTGITTGITLNEKELTESEAVKLIYNAMNVDVLQNISANENYEIVSGATLLDSRINNMEIEVRRGILTANSEVSLENSLSPEKEYVQLDYIKYRVNSNEFDDLIGCYVDAYIVEGKFVKAIFKHKNNTEFIIDAEDIEIFTDKSITYYQDDKKYSTKQIDDEAHILYNNRVIYDTPVKPLSGSVRMIDNDADGKYDVVFINDYQSFVVSHVSDENGIIYFKTYANDNISFRNKSSIYLNLDNDDNISVIENAEGEKLEISELKEGDVISVFASLDEKYIKIVVTDKRITGVINGYDKETVTVDDTQYPLNNTNKWDPLFDAQIGDNAELYFDVADKVIYAEATENTNQYYGYVLRASKPANALRDKPRVKILSFGAITKKVSKRDITDISYDVSNGNVETFNVSEKVKDFESLNLVGNVIIYTLNEEGEIRKIEFPSTYNRRQDYIFNSKLMSFGGTFEGGFIVNNNTNLICVPLSGSEDDIYQVINLKDENKYNIQAFDVDEKTFVAKAAVLISNMSPDVATPINNTSDVAIVKEMIQMLTDDGFVSYKVTLLDGDETKEILSNDNSSVISVVSGLVTGDLINYSQDAFGRINNIKVLAKTSECTTPFLINERQTDEQVFGPVYDLNINTFHSNLNEMIDFVEVLYDERGLTREYILPVEDAPPIYFFDTVRRTVENYKTSDMITYKNSSEYANKVFMLVCESTVRAVVVIK